jgi:ornithine decarboxylase
VSGAAGLLRKAFAVKITKTALRRLADKHGTALFIIDHDAIRRNYRHFKKNLPRVQAYYAVKANSNQEIIKTLFDEGCSFDVASYNEFMQVYEYIKHFEEQTRDFYIWDRIIFSNTIKDRQTLQKIKKYRPLVTYDNHDELEKIRTYCATAGLVLRLKVPDIGSQVEMSSKFGIDPGEALHLIRQTFDAGLVVEGLSFHVGSQCTNFDNYTAALQIAAEIFSDARKRGYPLKIVDIGGGFPVAYDASVPHLEKLGRIINSECVRLFPADTELIAEPGRFMVANAATLVSEIIGTARRDGKLFYYINDGVYHTFSGVVYDHWIPNFHAFKAGRPEVCAVVGPTCDSFDKISVSIELPGNLHVGDYLYTENIGAYSIASATRFNGFEGAKILHLNKK